MPFFGVPCLVIITKSYGIGKNYIIVFKREISGFPHFPLKDAFLIISYESNILRKYKVDLSCFPVSSICTSILFERSISLYDPHVNDNTNHTIVFHPDSSSMIRKRKEPDVIQSFEALFLFYHIRSISLFQTLPQPAFPLCIGKGGGIHRILPLYLQFIYDQIATLKSECIASLPHAA